MESNKHFLVGIFNDHDILISGVKKLRAEGVKIFEVYTPYPVHHLEHALGYKRSKMPVAAFFFGITGTILAILMQTLMLGVDWPMIIGGKPYIAYPDFVPVTFELTVLLASYGMGFTFFITRGLGPGAVPRMFDRRATDDKHVMAIDLSENKKSEDEIKALLESVSAEESYRKDFTDEENNPNFWKFLVDTMTNGVTSSSRQLN
ncbi:MAG: quinol:cytochrome C oxidoreductase [Thalassobius sp.]|nr:quinol:cytochrome C oxidoreductase [Thalassovita sp.]